MKRAKKIVWMVVPALLLALVATQATCQYGASLPRDTPSAIPVASTTISMATTQVARPTDPTTVRVYIKMVTRKHYGLLARLAGNRDSVERITEYAPENSWWENPLVVYEETPFIPSPDLTAGSDAAVITGQGNSSNVAVALTLVPHADIAIKALPACDSMKGTITVTIAAASAYYDGRWTEMVRVEDKVLVFTFDTCDPSRRLQPTGSETRTVPGFAFERYTRDQEKWEPRNAWPRKAQSGDWRITVHGHDATLNVTTYRYADRSVAGSPN